MTDYKLVPVEPTPEMLNRVCPVAYSLETRGPQQDAEKVKIAQGHHAHQREAMRSIYKAMLAAAPDMQGEAKGKIPAPMKIEHHAPGITIEKDILGTIHIKAGDFDYIQLQYQYPYTDNASQIAHAKAIADLLAGTARHPAPAVQGELATEEVTLFECVSCNHLYQSHITRCDCMPEEQKFNRWLARPESAEQRPAPDVAALVEALRGVISTENMEHAQAIANGALGRYWAAHRKGGE